MRQYFYLVVAEYDECTYPQKVFLQEHDAIQWGRREAAKNLMISHDPNWVYVLYKQEITRAGTLERVKELMPYPTKGLADAGLVRGSDFDIDRERR